MIFSKLNSRTLIIAGILLAGTFAFAQESLTYSGSSTYILKERTDLRRYDNGKYIGLVSREVSSYITPISDENGYLYDGSFFVMEETKRANIDVNLGINDAIPSVFKIDSEGNFTMVEDKGYPTYRSFPSYPKEQIKKGQSWTSKAERAIDPLNKGIVTKIPCYVQYTYTSDSVYYGEPVYVIQAQWATRYGMGTGNYYIDFGGDKDLVKASGSHKATIYVSKNNGAALLIRDTVDELFCFTDGLQVALKGTVSLFTEYPPSVETEKLLPALKRLASVSDTEINSSEWLDSGKNLAKVENESSNAQGLSYTKEELKAKTDRLLETINKNQKSNVKIEKTNAGLRLTIEDLQFKANSSELLPGEKERLDNIAAVLKSAPNNQFLIEGHTAAIGNPKGEMELSIERSHVIAKELVNRGIDVSKFICKGSGGTKPVADNSTGEGRAKNRRVEITILE